MCRLKCDKQKYLGQAFERTEIDSKKGVKTTGQKCKSTENRIIVVAKTR